MNVVAPMQLLGECAGVNWYWAPPGDFTVPGVYYWDGKANVHVDVANPGKHEVQTRFGPLACSLAISVAWEELVEHNTRLEAELAAPQQVDAVNIMVLEPSGFELAIERGEDGKWRCPYANHPAPPEANGFNILAHLRRQREWSERTFGPGSRTQGVVDHISKELLEILADPSDVSEWIDVVILALDGALRAGASPETIVHSIVAKQTKNEGRTWPDWRTADPNKAIEHDRSGEC